LLFKFLYYLQFKSKSFLDFIEDESAKLNDEISNFINKELNLNELEQKIMDLENYIIKQKETINNIKKELMELKYSKLNDIKIIKDKFKVYKNIINDIKLNIPLLSKPNEKLMSVIFNSFDENIHYSVVCKNTDEFSKIESLLYEKYPEYKKLNKNFIINGNKIDISKNLKDNKIQNSDIIILNIK